MGGVVDAVTNVMTLGMSGQMQQAREARKQSRRAEEASAKALREGGQRSRIAGDFGRRRTAGSGAGFARSNPGASLLNQPGANTLLGG